MFAALPDARQGRGPSGSGSPEAQRQSWQSGVKSVARVPSWEERSRTPTTSGRDGSSRTFSRFARWSTAPPNGCACARGAFARARSPRPPDVRLAISAPGAPKAIGPYTPAIKAGQLLFISGQIPLDPATGQIVSGDITAQTHRVMRNIGALLDAAGASFGNVV